MSRVPELASRSLLRTKGTHFREHFKSLRSINVGQKYMCYVERESDCFVRNIEILKT